MDDAQLVGLLDGDADALDDEALAALEAEAGVGAGGGGGPPPAVSPLLMLDPFDPFAGGADLDGLL